MKANHPTNSISMYLLTLALLASPFAMITTAEVQQESKAKRQERALEIKSRDRQATDAATASPSALADDTKPQLVVQLGHSSGITAIAISHDGRYALTGSNDSSALLWEVASGREVRRFLGHGTWLTDAAFSPDDRYVLTGCMDQTARLWEVDTGKEVRKFEEDAEVWAVAFSPDGKSVLTAGSKSGTARLWNIETGKPTVVFKGDGETIGDVAFSPDGRFVLTRSSKVARLWDATTGAEVRAFAGHTDSLHTVAFSPDGKSVLTASQDKTARLWDAETGTVRFKIEGHTGWVRLANFSPDGKQIMTSGQDSTLRFWDARSGQFIRGYQTRGMTAAAAFAPNNKEVLIEIGYRVGLMDIESGALVRVFTGQAIAVEQIARSADGRFLATANEFGMVAVWDVEIGKQTKQIMTQADAVFGLAFSPDSRYVLTGSRDKTVRLFDVENGAEVRRFVGHEHTVKTVAYSPDGKTVLSGAGDGTARLWDIETGKQIKQFEGGVQSVNAVAYSPEGRYVLTAGNKGYARIWEIESGEEVRRFYDGGEEINAALFSPDRKYVLTGDDDQVARLWEVESNKLVRKFNGHEFQVSSVAFSPDGKYAVTGSFDRTARLWEVETGKAIKTFSGHTNLVQTAIFSSDGKYIISGGDDCTTRLWDTASGSELCRLVSFIDGAWAVVDSEGRFDADNLEEITGLHWVVPDNPRTPLSVEIFMRDYYEPRLLTRKLAGDALGQPRKLADLNRVQPQVNITAIERQGNSDRVSVTVEVATSAAEFKLGGQTVRRETGVYDLRLFRDGQLVGQRADGAAVKLRPSANERERLLAWRKESELKTDTSGKRTVKFENVRLPRQADSKEVVFSAYAFNEDRVKSKTDRKTFARPADLAPARGRAYIVSVGVNAYENADFDLGFAANDARRMQKLIPEALIQSGRYEEVVSVPLISDYVGEGKQRRVTQRAATKSNVKAVLEMLAGRTVAQEIRKQIPNGDRVQAARPEDFLLLSFSSHGVADDDGTFFFITYDTGKGAGKEISEAMLARAISSDELSAWLKEIDAGDMVMIVDACHSAATVNAQGFKPAPMGSRGLGQLAYDKGMKILASTQADDVALEFEKLEQGLMTYALTRDGLEARQADFAPPDRAITLSEWLAYGAKRVGELHAELRQGELQSFGLGVEKRALIVRKNGAANAPKEKASAQRPSLFDFSRRRYDVRLIELK